MVIELVRLCATREPHEPPGYSPLFFSSFRFLCGRSRIPNAHNHSLTPTGKGIQIIDYSIGAVSAAADHKEEISTDLNIRHVSAIERLLECPLRLATIEKSLPTLGSHTALLPPKNTRKASYGVTNPPPRFWHFSCYSSASTCISLVLGVEAALLVLYTCITSP